MFFAYFRVDVSPFLLEPAVFFLAAVRGQGIFVSALLDAHASLSHEQGVPLVEALEHLVEGIAREIPEPGAPEEEGEKEERRKGT